MGLLSGTLLLLLRLATALNPLQKLLVEGELRRRPDWVDGGAAQVAPRVWRWVAEADDAVLALPELSEADARRLAVSLEAAGAAVEASAPAATWSCARLPRRTRPRFRQTISRAPSNSWRATRGKLPKRGSKSRIVKRGEDL